jgi:hypothetical protein
MGEILSFFILDDRHEVPSLVMLVGETEDSARALAIADLRANPHHLAIELRVDDTLVFALRRDQLSEDTSSQGLGVA